MERSGARIGERVKDLSSGPSLERTPRTFRTLAVPCRRVTGPCPSGIAGARGPNASTMRPMSDPVRERWAAGEVALNAWSTFGGASAASVLAAAGFDAVTVDLQHGEHTLERLGEVVAAVERAGAVPFVRLGWNDPTSVMRALDLGA